MIYKKRIVASFGGCQIEPLKGFRISVEIEIVKSTALNPSINGFMGIIDIKNELIDADGKCCG